MKVPQYEKRVTTDGLRIPANTTHASTINFGAGGAAVLAGAGDVLMKEHQRATVADTQNAMLQISEYATERFNNTKDGVITKQQRNALNVADIYLSELDGKFQEVSDNLTNPVARSLFQQQYRDFRNQNARRAMQYETSQIKAYENNMAEGMLTNLSTSLSNAHGDNEATTYYANQIKQQVALMGLSNGWSKEYMQSMEHKYIYSASVANVSNLVSSNYIEAQNLFGEPESVISKTGARGERNNNPGNLIFSKNGWVGQTGKDGDFAVFATPEHGIRALSKNLISYGNKGFDTVSSIIPRWAPDGNEESYIKFVSEKLGIGPDDKLDLNNIETLTNLSKAIIHFENGQNQYSNEQVAKGVQAAMGIVMLETPVGSPNRVTSSLAFNTLTPTDQVRFLKQIETMEKADRSQYKSDLELRVKDANAAYDQGKDFPNPPNESDFIKAYGYYDGKRNHANFIKNQNLGADIALIQDMPMKDIQALVTNREPQVGEGYANNSARYETLVKAATQIINQRNGDPVAFAYKLGRTKELDFTSNENLQNTLTERITQATHVSSDYQTPLTIFSKTEKEAIAGMFDKLSAPEINSMLKIFRQSAGDNITAYNAILKQVGADHPSIAFAGGVLNTGKDVKVKDKGGLFSWFSDPMYENPEQISSTILLGRQSRKGVDGIKGYQTPSGTNNDPKVYFDKYVGDAFKGSWGAYDNVYQTALDYYAGESVKVGDFSKELNRDRWDEAIRAATGGIIDFNGSKTLLPYGMDETLFNDRIKEQYYKKVVNTGVVEGETDKKSLFHVYDPTYNTKIDKQDLSSMVMPYQLERRKDGQYYIVNGTTYLYEGDGDNVKAIVLDVYEDN